MTTHPKGRISDIREKERTRIHKALREQQKKATRIDRRPLFCAETYLTIIEQDETLPRPLRMVRADEYRRTHQMTGS